MSGFVIHNDSIIGYLLKDIPAKYHRLDEIIPGSFDYACVKVSTLPPLSSRQKRIRQLRHAESQLLIAGLDWFWPEPQHIMIDEDDNAWIILDENFMYNSGEKERYYYSGIKSRRDSYPESMVKMGQMQDAEEQVQGLHEIEKHLLLGEDKEA